MYGKKMVPLGHVPHLIKTGSGGKRIPETTSLYTCSNSSAFRTTLLALLNKVFRFENVQWLKFQKKYLSLTSNKIGSNGICIIKKKVVKDS